MARRKPGNDPKPLRERAEELLRTTPASVPTLPTREVQTVVHELNIHQVELEIQNEELRQAQVELANARDRYVDLYEFAPVGYATLDQQGRIQSANLTTAVLLAVERSQLIGKRLEEHVAQESRDACYVLLRQAAGTTDRPTAELRLNRLDGVARWVLMGVAWRESKGTDPGEWWVTFHDITQRKQADAVLKKLNETLEHRVAERTSTLKLLGDVASAANNAENLEEAFEYTLGRAGKQHGWCFGQAYLREESDSDVLTVVRPFYETPPGRFRRFRAATRRTPLRVGQGLPGRALATGAGQWANDMRQELVARWARVGRKLGVRCGAAFPIFAGHEVVGVLEFFSDEQIEQTDELLDSFGGIGTILGRVVERQRFERNRARALFAEQQRLGDDLHDTVGQSMAALALIAERLAHEAQSGTPSDAARLTELSDGLRHTLQDTRTVVRSLLPLTEVRGEAFAAAIRELAASMGRRYNLACEVDCPQPISVDVPDVALHLYRIVAEALANATKHSRARRIVLRLVIKDQMLVLEVRDDGVGLPADADRRGAGLGIMRHRAKAIGASLDIRRGAERGTVVACTLPEDELRRSDVEEA